MKGDRDAKADGANLVASAPPMGPDTCSALEGLIPMLEDSAFAAGAWRAAAGQMPYYQPSETARQVVQALSTHRVVYAFDWTSWQDEGRRYVESPELVKSADLDTCRRLLTMHIRVDRFAQGHLATMFDSGHILAILRRIVCLMGGQP